MVLPLKHSHYEGFVKYLWQHGKIDARSAFSVLNDEKLAIFRDIANTNAVESNETFDSIVEKLSLRSQMWKLVALSLDMRETVIRFVIMYREYITLARMYGYDATNAADSATPVSDEFVNVIEIRQSMLADNDAITMRDIAKERLFVARGRMYVNKRTISRLEKELRSFREQNDRMYTLMRQREIDVVRKHDQICARQYVLTAKQADVKRLLNEYDDIASDLSTSISVQEVTSAIAARYAALRREEDERNAQTLLEARTNIDEAKKHLLDAQRYANDIRDTEQTLNVAIRSVSERLTTLLRGINEETTRAKTDGENISKVLDIFPATRITTKHKVERYARNAKLRYPAILNTREMSVMCRQVSRALSNLLCSFTEASLTLMQNQAIADSRFAVAILIALLHKYRERNDASFSGLRTAVRTGNFYIDSNLISRNFNEDYHFYSELGNYYRTLREIDRATFIYILDQFE